MDFINFIFGATSVAAQIAQQPIPPNIAPIPAPQVVPQAVQTIVDLSHANLIAGAIIGLMSASLFFLILGYIIFRSGGRLKFGSTQQPQQYQAEYEEIKEEIKSLVGEIKSDLKKYRDEHQQCQVMLPEKYVQWEALKSILNEIKEDRRIKWERFENKFDKHTHDKESGRATMGN